MPSTTHHTYCEFHLGDNLFHLHFLRALARARPDERFLHAAHGCHLEQMREVVADLPNIALIRLEDRAPESVNAWKDAGGFFGRHPRNWAYYEFYLEWFAELARRMGLESPFTTMTDLLFDYPALRRPVWRDVEFDTLLVNSQPCSGQWMAWHRADQTLLMEGLARRMAEKTRLIVTQAVPEMDASCSACGAAVHYDPHSALWHHLGNEGALRDAEHEACAPRSKMLCTREGNLSVSQIGALSLRCRNLVMIGTGPAWPTCNVFNRESVKLRIVLLDPERVNYDPAIRHARDFAEMEAMLTAEGLL